MTDPLIAAGSDELDYRYPGAMRWSPEAAERRHPGDGYPAPRVPVEDMPKVPAGPGPGSGPTTTKED